MGPELVSATFAPEIGERFAVAPAAGEPFEAVLSRCEDTSYGSPEAWRAGVGRVPFSLLFHADARDALRQQICVLEHPRLGRFQLFLVPLGPDERGMRYEAVIG